ncbi:hypothetical protein SDJN03_01743, partial [Cucurbita argyrosperma subsp. sororia]
MLAVVPKVGSSSGSSFNLADAKVKVDERLRFVFKSGIAKFRTHRIQWNIAHVTLQEGHDERRSCHLERRWSTVSPPHYKQAGRHSRRSCAQVLPAISAFPN